MTNTNGTFTVAGLTIDHTTLPATSVAALISRGLSHYFGNEIASKLSTVKTKFKEDKEANPSGADLDDEAIAAKRQEFVAAAHAKLLDGTVGVQAPRVPSADPLDVEKQRIAKAEVLAILKANDLKAPKKDEGVRFADGTVKTMEMMVATRIERNDERITKEAKKVLADKAKRVKAAEETKAASADVLHAEALGI